MEDLWAADPGGPRFRVVLRGYERRQVDECVQLARLSKRDPAAAEALRVRLRSTPFDVVLRGYDRHEVERYFLPFNR
jgi:hypothetical protein